MDVMARAESGIPFGQGVQVFGVGALYDGFPMCPESFSQPRIPGRYCCRVTTDPAKRRASAQKARSAPTATPGAGALLSIHLQSRSTASSIPRGNAITLHGAILTFAREPGGSAIRGLDATGLAPFDGSQTRKSVNTLSGSFERDGALLKSLGQPGRAGVVRMVPGLHIDVFGVCLFRPATDSLFEASPQRTRLPSQALARSIMMAITPFRRISGNGSSPGRRPHGRAWHGVESWIKWHISNHEILCQARKSALKGSTDHESPTSNWCPLPGLHASFTSYRFRWFNPTAIHGSPFRVTPRGLPELNSRLASQARFEHSPGVRQEDLGQAQGSA